MDEAAAARGRRFTHYLQTNLISYSPAWNEVLRTMFGGSLGTSMDFPNLHRKLFNGGAEAYTAIWTQRLREAQAAGLEIGVIAVLHQGSLDAGPDAFYRYYTEELGLINFQVNTPFPGGPAKQVEAEFDLDKTALAEFLAGLFDIWMERGHATGVALGPFDSLIHHFTGAPARLPCIWKENCSNQFISVDSKGTVAQCDCWVTSYPESFFGNVFREPDLTQMLRTSPARREFVERPEASRRTRGLSRMPLSFHLPRRLPRAHLQRARHHAGQGPVLRSLQGRLRSRRDPQPRAPAPSGNN